MAIGNPFGLGSTVTNGIISNRARDIMLRSGGRSRANDNYVDDFMQHSAAINMGNSGGPLLNLKGETIGAIEVPGLKTHIATLVAPDTPAGQPWPEVYIHAKLMLIDDAFMTLGSANINTRSMQADSEMNIAHHRPEITRPLREQQWAKYTNGRVTAGMAFKDSYKVWEKLIQKSATAKRDRQRPVSQLADFLRDSPEMSNKD